ncbi:Leucine-rich repeat domain superfamily [Sesbania bispinosa]|nr:Leucine-rich repeat domain superfamily [Sesbania bispinosa]
MELSNSNHLVETPQFPWASKLERLDLTGCTNLLQVHPSIGLLTELAFLSLQNCSSLISLDFDNLSNLSCLKVLCLSGCTKLKNMPNFRRAINLEYLDMDRYESLYTVNESIGALTKLRFLSMRECCNIVTIPNSVNNMTSLITLDLCKCSNFMNLPLTETFSSSLYLKSLISLDVSFCNLHEIPDALGDLWILERMNLQGNNFVTLPSTIKKLYSLSYLNMAHCHVQSLPRLPSISASSVGRYFKTASGSRDHRNPATSDVVLTLFFLGIWK